MSVVVRMEMPKDCWLCPSGHQDWIYNDEGSAQMVCFCNICNTEEDNRYITETEDNRPDWCPIIRQLPEGHGRLVDADAYDYPGDLKWEPTIVPAERSET